MVLHYLTNLSFNYARNIFLSLQKHVGRSYILHEIKFTVILNAD